MPEDEEPWDSQAKSPTSTGWQRNSEQGSLSKYKCVKGQQHHTQGRGHRTVPGEGHQDVRLLFQLFASPYMSVRIAEALECVDTQTHTGTQHRQMWGLQPVPWSRAPAVWDLGSSTLSRASLQPAWCQSSAIIC
jgi:hypothetical protein